MAEKPNSYKLSRAWFDFCFENPDKTKPTHTAVYFFAIEHCNRLGWKEKFGFPTTMVMEALGIKSYNTYIKILNQLVEWKFIKMIEKSKNQYSANIIALSFFNKALDKALDKALSKHATKQSESTVQSIDSIIKQVTNKQYNKEQVTRLKKSCDLFLDEKSKRFSPPTLEEIKVYCSERNNSIDSEKFRDFYESKNWMIGKNKMKDWKACVRTWEKKDNTNNKKLKSHINKDQDEW